MTTVRLEEQAQFILENLSKELSLSKTSTVTRALDTLQNELFYSKLRGANDRLRADAEAMSLHRKDIEAWDRTVSDGLAKEEDWPGEW